MIPQRTQPHQEVLCSVSAALSGAAVEESAAASELPSLQDHGQFRAAPPGSTEPQRGMESPSSATGAAPGDPGAADPGPDETPHMVKW